jgi:uncharacterized protein (TIGR02996 family)
MSADLRPFVEAIAANHGDARQLLVLADYLEGQGDVAAEGLRLAARRRWWPATVEIDFHHDGIPGFRLVYAWIRITFCLDEATGRRGRLGALPWWLFANMQGHPVLYREGLGRVYLYETALQTWEAFLDAFRRAVANGDWPDPPHPYRLRLKR